MAKAVWTCPSRYRRRWPASRVREGEGDVVDGVHLAVAGGVSSRTVVEGGFRKGHQRSSGPEFITNPSDRARSRRPSPTKKKAKRRDEKERRAEKGGKKAQHPELCRCSSGWHPPLVSAPTGVHLWEVVEVGSVLFRWADAESKRWNDSKGMIHLRQPAGWNRHHDARQGSAQNYARDEVKGRTGGGRTAASTNSLVLDRKRLARAIRLIPSQEMSPIPRNSMKIRPRDHQIRSQRK